MYALLCGPVTSFQSCSISIIIYALMEDDEAFDYESCGVGRDNVVQPQDIETEVVQVELNDDEDIASIQTL